MERNTYGRVTSVRVDYIGTHRGSPNRWGVFREDGRLIWDCCSLESAVERAEAESINQSDETLGQICYVDLSEAAHALAFGEW